MFEYIKEVLGNVHISYDSEECRISGQLTEFMRFQRFKAIFCILLIIINWRTLVFLL